MRPGLKEILQDLPKTSHGQALKEYLDFKYDEINDVTTATTMEEVKGRQHALKLIEDIFNFYVDNSVSGSKKTRYT